MIKAYLHVFGHPTLQIDWGEWEFAALPAVGDYVELPNMNAGKRHVRVKLIDHRPKMVGSSADTRPYVIVVADWFHQYP